MVEIAGGIKTLAKQQVLDYRATLKHQDNDLGSSHGALPCKANSFASVNTGD